MKTLRKILVVALFSLAGFALASCGNTGNETKKEKIVLVTDIGDIDDKSFNEGTWNGVVKFAEENNLVKDKDYAYVKPAEKGDDPYISAIETSIKNGATTIVCPGFLFQTAINAMQTKYPKVRFIIIDGNPAHAEEGSLGKNTHSVFFKEEEAGFLAGYAMVYEGYRKLGFMGGAAVPAVVKFGHGYIQGANVAAQELGLAGNEIDMQYLYTGDFQDTPKVQSQAKSLFDGGTEVIFACGGPVTFSVNKARQGLTDKWGIGVDSNQNHLEGIITSAVKGVDVATYNALCAIKDGTWEKDFGGKSITIGAKEGAVSLPSADKDVEKNPSKFKKFTKEQYDAIYKKLVEGKFKIKTNIDEKDPKKAIDSILDLSLIHI